MSRRNLPFVIPSAEFGGISTGLLGITRYLNARRYRPLAVALSKGPAVGLFGKQGIPCSVAPSTRTQA